MLTKSRAWPLIAALAIALPAIVSCDKMDKLKAAAAKLQKGKSTAATPEADLPVVQGTYSSDQVSELKQAGYPAFVARTNAVVIVDFTATWCGPSKMMGPVLDKAAELHPGVVYVGKVDVDKEPQLAAAQGVSSIPDVRIFKDGKEVEKFVGFLGESEVLEKIASLAAGVVPAAPMAGVPGAAQSSQPEVQPFSKGWLPPGMSRGQVNLLNGSKTGSADFSLPRYIETFSVS